MTLVLSALAIAQQPVFRTGVTHVLLDVVVTDKDDRPVTDLTAADFEIREAGKLQTIADFERVSVPLANRAFDLKAAPTPPPDVASNAPPPHTGRAIVFVMDILTYPNLIPIQRVMAEFMRTLTADDEVAVVFPKSGDLSQDFTRDPGLIARAVRNMGDAITRGGMKWRPGQMLKYVIEALSAARENRRLIVLVSEGWVGVGPGQEVFEALELAKQRGIPIYGLDPRGLMAPELGFEGHMENQTPEARMALDVANRMAKGGLQEVAENTNALAFVNAWNMKQAVDDIVTDSGSYYLLGFYPDPDTKDGEYHDVKVSVARPGLRVRARSGYLAEKPRAAPATASALRNSLGDGLPGGDLLLRAHAAPVSPSSRGANTLLTLDVTYPEPAPGTLRADDHLNLAWIALDQDAKVRASGTREVLVPTAGMNRGAFTLSVDDLLDLPKGQTILRIGVSSRMLGTHGTVHVGLDVPPLTGKAPELSPIIVGVEGGQSVRVAHLGESAKAAPFQPTTSRTFAAQQRLKIFTRVFGVKLADVRIEFTLKVGDAVVRTVPMTPKASSTRDAIDAEGALSLAGLAPGTYALEVTASAGAKVSLSRAVAFEIK